jgi:hypothetical protein
MRVPTLVTLLDLLRRLCLLSSLDCSSGYSLSAVAWLMLSRNSGRALLSHLWSAVTGRTLSIEVSQPTVVDRIQRLQRLETVVYTMDKLVTGAKENPIFPDFLAGDRLLMMVHGEVVAGIDFSNLKLGDVRVDGKLIHLHLPASHRLRVRFLALRSPLSRAGV